MKRITAIFLALVMTFALALGNVNAGALYLKGDSVAAYTVTKAETHTLGEGLEYNEFSFNDKNGVEQTCFTMTFNPKESYFRSYVYHTRASHGYTITDDAKNAAASGLDVYAAVNGDFFSMETDSYGTPIGMYVTAGKLSVASVGLAEYNFAVAPDGTADVVYSRLGYSLTIGGIDYSKNLYAVNKRAADYGNNNIYYFDSDIGPATPTGAATGRTELVCDITEGVISVGGTLKGAVNAVKNSGGAAIGEGQFVLSVGSGVDVSAIAAGAEVVLTVEETVAQSKAVMENAAHVLYGYQTLKVDGYDRWANNELDNRGLSDQFAQRCVVGIKEDGTLIYLVCDGRRTTDAGTNGFDYNMIMELMEPYNCTDIVNFDGGGSTAVVVGEGDKKFNWEFIGQGEGRPVANSLLIVRDPSAPPTEEEQYGPIVDKEGTELRNVAINKDYVIRQYGCNAPTYQSTVQGDTSGRKLTNGKKRTAEDSGDYLSSTFVGGKLQLNMVVDLAQVREDIRNVTWKGVTSSGTRSFDPVNLIAYVSEDGQHWSKSVAGTLSRKGAGISGVFDYVYTFKAAQKARYVKLIFASTTSALQFDELEINAMVNKSEPVEEPIPEDISTLPAETPSDKCENVALGKGYTITCNGQEIAPHTATTEPRYYSAETADATPLKLTDGKLGTLGTYHDGATLGLRTGPGANIEIIVDLGAEIEGIQFVQLLNVIDNGSSFGKLEEAVLSHSSDGTEYTEESVRINAAAGNQQYNSLTLQFNKTVAARYIKISIITPEYLLGLGELQVLTEAPKANYGDVNGDGKINSLDAATVLKYDAELTKLTDEQMFAADVNCDQKVNSLDAAMILKYDAELISKFPADE